MNELIKIDYSNDRPAVLARDLHEFLEVGARFNDWFPRMCEYGFTEGQDYYSILSNRSDGLPGKPRQDAALSIDMAKEICMLQRNEKGKIARQYFSPVGEGLEQPRKGYGPCPPERFAALCKLAGAVIGIMEREDATPAEILETARLLVELGRW